jgi:hypothetical protein
VSNERIEVVKALLAAKYGIIETETIARQIIEALDQRALSTKWDDQRIKLLYSASGKWIPHSDLLEEINKLPGVAVTMGDLRAQMAERAGPATYFNSTYRDGNPDLQAACLRVYAQEKRDGTSFAAILKLIDDKVVGPADDSEFWAIREARKVARKKRQKELLRSKKDFTVQPFEDHYPVHYGRQGGQLYRLTRVGDNAGDDWGKWMVFRIANLDDEGQPTKPHIMRYAEARAAIKSGQLK